MEQLFIITRQNRKILYSYLKNTPITQLTKVPEGFNNNIWWNIAHVMVTQQKLVYGLSGLPFLISKDWVSRFEKGTAPIEVPSLQEVNALSELLFSTLEQTESDYKKGMFQKFRSYMTSPKIPLNSVEDAIAFNVFHEGLHLGSIMALSRAIKV